MGKSVNWSIIRVKSETYLNKYYRVIFIRYALTNHRVDCYRYFEQVVNVILLLAGKNACFILICGYAFAF